MLFDATSQRAVKPSRGLAALGFLVVHLLVFWQAYRWPWITQLALNLISWAIGFFLLRYWLAGEGKSPDRSNVGPPRQILST